MEAAKCGHLLDHHFKTNIYKKKCFNEKIGNCLFHTHKQKSSKVRKSHRQSQKQKVCVVKIKVLACLHLALSNGAYHLSGQLQGP